MHELAPLAEYAVVSLASSSGDIGLNGFEGVSNAPPKIQFRRHRCWKPMKPDRYQPMDRYGLGQKVLSGPVD
jgi:hypothetical protein